MSSQFKIAQNKANLLNFSQYFDLTKDSERSYSSEFAKQFYIRLVMNCGVRNSLEIGAYKADLSRTVKNMNKDINCLAYEASPYNYKLFMEEIKYAEAGVNYINAAISDLDGFVTFRLQDKKTASLSAKFAATIPL